VKRKIERRVADAEERHAEPLEEMRKQGHVPSALSMVQPEIGGKGEIYRLI
jgi:hypothetical protein